MVQPDMCCDLVVDVVGASEVADKLMEKKLNNAMSTGAAVLVSDNRGV